MLLIRAILAMLLLTAILGASVEAEARSDEKPESPRDASGLSVE